MFEHLRQKLTRLLASRKGRSGSLRMRWPFERLEDRNMLSASFGGMSYGPKQFDHGGGDVGQRGGGDLRHGAATSYVSYPQHSAGYESRDFSHGRGLGHDFSGFQDRSPAWQDYQFRPYMHDAFGPPSRSQSYFASWSPYQSWGHDFVESVPLHDVSAGPPPLYEPVIVPSLPIASSAPLAPIYASSPPPVRIITVFVEPIVTYIVSHKPPGRTEIPILASLELPELPIPSATDVLALTSTLPDLPATEQLLGHDGSAVAILAATARDLAFQSFAPNLLLMTTPAASDRVNNIDLSVKDIAQAEPLDGFIQTHDHSIIDDIVRSTDAVTQEREAIDAVLQQLRDVDTPLPANDPTNIASALGQSTNGDDPTFQIDLLQTETLADELPAGEVQGGMVLLHSSGNANENNFDLTPVYAEHVEHVSVPASMETSVGLVQEVDVVADETPAMETARPSDSTVQPQTQIRIDAPLQTQREQSTSRKSAALIGATTLTGALVWISRRGSQSGLPESNAKRRRLA